MRYLVAVFAAMWTCSLLARPANRVSYDARCVQIDGKDTFLYSGAFHYFRCPRALWPERFRLIKAAGFNTVETYVAWNDSERAAPKSLDDYRNVDLRDFDAWLSMASERFGLNVIVRPGPYICAEWDMGGYPSWLLTKLPSHPTRVPWLRSDDPTYLAWCRHWYRAVIPVIARHQVTRKAHGKPGVILVQIENEYDYADGNDQVHLGQLHELAKDALAGGIDVPLITCWTHQIRTTTDPILKPVIDCDNFYPRWDVNGIKGSLDRLRREQPNKPMMVTEMQGGWFSEIGGLLAEDQDGITAAQIRNLTLYSIQNGLSGLNYYMLFGGTNFGDRTPPNITTSYDYDAPIREDGSVGAKYEEVAAIGSFLRKYGSKLIRSEPDSENAGSDRPEVEVSVKRCADGARFVFIRSTDRSNPHRGTFHVGDQTAPYFLTPFGSFVVVLAPGERLGGGAWFPKVAHPVHPSRDAEQFPIVDALGRPDPGSTQASPAIFGDVTRAGVLGNGFVLYRTVIKNHPPKSQLILRVGEGNLIVSFNGTPQTEVGRSADQRFYEIPDDLVGNRSQGSTPALKVEALYENPGRPNGGAGMEAPHGLLGAELWTGRLPEVRLENWVFTARSPSDKLPVQINQIDVKGNPLTLHDGEWQDAMSTPNAEGVFRTRFKVVKSQVQDHHARLEFDGIDDEGWVYLNGQKVAETHRWNEPISVEVSSRLREGPNDLVVVVKNHEGQGGIYRVPRLVWEGGQEHPESIDPWTTANLTGVSEHWDAQSSVGPDWHRVSLNTVRKLPRKIKSGSAGPAETDAPTQALAYWYHLDFPLQEVTESMSLRLDALGNGFLTLNGHALGRFWQVGPQREYYLPSCWLHKGHNVLVVALRQVDGYALVRAAAITKYGG